MKTFCAIALAAFVSAQEYADEDFMSQTTTGSVLAQSSAIQIKKWSAAKIIKAQPCPSAMCVTHPSYTCVKNTEKNARGCAKYPCGRCFKKAIQVPRRIRRRVMCGCYRCPRYAVLKAMKLVCKKHPTSGKRICRGVAVPPKETCTTTRSTEKNSRGCMKYPCGIRKCKKFKPKPVPTKSCATARCVRKPLCTYSRGPLLKNGCPKHVCGIAKCQKPITSAPKPTRSIKPVVKPTLKPKSNHAVKNGNIVFQSSVVIHFKP